MHTHSTSEMGHKQTNQARQCRVCLCSANRLQSAAKLLPRSSTRPHLRRDVLSGGPRSLRNCGVSQREQFDGGDLLVIYAQCLARCWIHKMNLLARKTCNCLVGFAFGCGNIIGKPALNVMAGRTASVEKGCHVVP